MVEGLTMNALFPAFRGVGTLDDLLNEPVSFPAYMELFSENYSNLLVLLGGSIKPIRIKSKHSEITFRLIRKKKYTAMLRMTYKIFKNNGENAVTPLDAIIYIYYDTWQAELVKVRGVFNEQLKTYEEFGMIVRRWLLNAFLRRILETLNARQAVTSEVK